MDQQQAPDAMNPQMRIELLARLGLPANAGAGHIEAAYRSSLAMLDRLPVEQQEWATGQRAELDAIRSLLADQAPAVQSSAPGVEAANMSSSTSEVANSPIGAAEGSRRRIIMASVGALLIVIIGAAGFAVLNSKSGVPGITGTPTNTSSPSASASLDMAQVAALMQKIAANPKDVTSLLGLAGQYFQATDYANATHFAQEATVAAPKNDTAWVALGAAQFNAGKNTEAKVSWDKAVAINPKNAEAHYDLGFYYLSGTSPDMAKVKSEWQQVVAIDPKSDLAKTVQTHLASLSSATPTPAPTTSGK